MSFLLKEQNKEKDDQGIDQEHENPQDRAAAEQKLIIDSFVAFASDFGLIDKHNDDPTIDETVAAYIANTIRQFYEEYENMPIMSCATAPSNPLHSLHSLSSVSSVSECELLRAAADEFDSLEGFVEVIDAYVFGFSSLDKSDILHWLITLNNEIKEKVTAQAQAKSKEKEEKHHERQEQEQEQKSEKKEKKKKKKQQQQQATLEEKEKTKGKKELELGNDPNLQVLIEMFPEMRLKEISRVYKSANQDYETAIDKLLTLQDTSETTRKKTAQELAQDEEERRILKEKTVEKYGFIAVKEKSDGKEKPSKIHYEVKDEKKLIRYYESKVVTTKGEKKFELKTEEDLEKEKAMKKTYCNLKPARYYRFH